MSSLPPSKPAATGAGSSGANKAPKKPPYVSSGESLDHFLRGFWQRQISTAEEEQPDFRHPTLPLARIKKVMKSDPEVQMVAADAPIIFCKACETEVTARAFIIADSNKRRTLSRSDIAKALAKSDQFDFLIDIVPREEVEGRGSGSKSTSATAGGGHATTNVSGAEGGQGQASSTGGPTGSAPKGAGKRRENNADTGPLSVGPLVHSSAGAPQETDLESLLNYRPEGPGTRRDETADHGVILLQSLLNPTPEGGM